MNFDNFTFRCSSLGYIMVDPKGKSNMQKYQEAKSWYEENFAKYQAMNKDTKAADTLLEKLVKKGELINKLEPVKDVVHLSETCKTHLADIYTAVKYGRSEEVHNKYVEKGLLLEEDAITLYSLFTGKFHKKNKQRRCNSFIEGEMDFEDDGDYVNDTKVNWSIFQFIRTVSRPLKPLYVWQVKGYMWLWNKNMARVIYCLLNTPEHLIAREELKLMYDMFGTKEQFDYSTEEEKTLYREGCAEIRRNHLYEDIPLEEKIRVFEVERNTIDEDRIANRVVECRKYLNSIENKEVIEEDEVEEAA